MQAIGMKTMGPSTMPLRSASVKRSVAASAYTKGQNSTNLEYLKSLPGATAPFPDVFDPAGLSSLVGTKDLKRWRESELVHGRVAMLASVGFLIGENVEDSKAFFNFDGRITGPAIYQFQQVRQGFWEPLLIAIGLAESYRVLKGWATPVGGQNLNALKDDYEAGDLGFDPLGLKPKDPRAWKDIQDKELNNGRLAMIAVAGFTAQELVSHQEIFEHLFLRLNPSNPIPPPGIPAGAVSWVPDVAPQFVGAQHSPNDVYQVAFFSDPGEAFDKAKESVQGLPKPSLPDVPTPNLPNLPKPPVVPPVGDVLDKASKSFQGLPKPTLPDVPRPGPNGPAFKDAIPYTPYLPGQNPEAK